MRIAPRVPPKTIMAAVGCWSAVHSVRLTFFWPKALARIERYDVRRSDGRTGQPLNGGRVGIRLRLAVGLRVRVPGRITRFVDIRDVRARRSGQARLLLVSVVNRGNVTESLAGRVSLVLLRRGRVISRLRARERRDVFPGAHAVLALRYRGHATGLVTAVATVALGDGIRRTERRYRLRL